MRGGHIVHRVLLLFYLALWIASATSVQPTLKKQEPDDALAKVASRCSSLFEWAYNAPHSGLEPSPRAYFPVLSSRAYDTRLFRLPSRPKLMPAASASSLLNLKDKHIYFFGDSTLRQLWGAFLKLSHGHAPGGDLSFEGLKQHVRHDCTAQWPVQRYWPPPHDPLECFRNEKTCTNTERTLPMFGSDVRVTYDWKHFLYEDYDRYLFQVKWKDDKDVPDVLLDTAYHVRQLHLLGKDLAAISKRTGMQVVWVDAVPFMEAYSCTAMINYEAYTIALRHGFFYFSRSTYISTAPHINATAPDRHYAEDVLDELAALLVGFLHCATAQ